MSRKFHLNRRVFLSDNSRILDVGIGPASALLANERLIVEKKLSVVGVDYDEVYIEYGKKLVEKSTKLFKKKEPRSSNWLGFFLS